MPPAGEGDPIARPLFADSDEVRAFERSLPTSYVGRSIVYMEEVASTNGVARERVRGGSPEGLVVVAEHQTHGRGRHGNKWLARPGEALLFSVLLRPSCSATELGRIAAAGAVAAARACAEEARIDWPNDLVARGKKLGGVLVEAGLKGRDVEFAVVGVGLNVQGVPEGMEESAISLSSLGWNGRRKELLGRALRELERALSLRPDVLVAEFNALCRTIGEEVELEDGRKARAAGVDALCRLVVGTGREAYAISSPVAIKER